MNGFLALLCAVPADTGKWFADKGRRLVRFVSADHPYVYLSGCVLCALCVLIWRCSSRCGFFLASMPAVCASLALCALFVLAALAALADKLRLGRTYRSRSRFCTAAARRASRYGSYVVWAVFALFAADRIHVLFQVISEVTGMDSAPTPFFQSMVYMLYNSKSLFLTGLWTTLRLAFFGTIFGFLLAVGLVFLRIQKPGRRDRDHIKFLKVVCSRFSLLYVTVVRGTPMMLQACIIYYAGFGLFTDHTSLSVTEINTIWSFYIAGLTTVSLNSAAYLSEVLRGGVESIDAGQTEAARSLGMSAWQAMMKVVFPQALKNSIPAIGNEMIINIKDSSVLNVIGVVELMYAASSVAGIYYKYLPNYVTAAVIYLILTCCISALLNKLSRKLSLSTYRGIPSSN